MFRRKMQPRQKEERRSPAALQEHEVRLADAHAVKHGAVSADEQVLKDDPSLKNHLFASLSGKMILFTMKKMTMETPPLSRTVTML